MKILISKLYYNFRNLILYGIISLCTSSLDFLCFWVLTNYIGVHYLLANCISVIIGITTSFILNRKYNFKVKDKVAKRFAIFFTVGLCGMLLSNIILWIGIDKLNCDKTITKLASIFIVVFFQFLMNKYVTFRVKKINSNN